MNDIQYFNDLLARTEELFYHELSDCAAWKTEFIGIDFIKARDIKGETPAEIIQCCIREIAAAGLIQGASYSIIGRDILFNLKVQGCIHIPKEVKLQRGGIKPFNCPIVNMVLDQLIERLGFASTYVADLAVDAETGVCVIKSAIYETPAKVGDVSDWNEEFRKMEEEGGWIVVEC